MTFTYFKTLYNSKITEKTTDEEKIHIIRKILHTKKYTSFNDKKELVKKILTDNVTIINEKVMYDSNDLFFNFTNTVLSYCTDFDYSEKLYDDLNENNLLDYVISGMMKEYSNYVEIMDNYISDMEMGRTPQWVNINNLSK